MDEEQWLDTKERMRQNMDKFQGIIDGKKKLLKFYEQKYGKN